MKQILCKSKLKVFSSQFMLFFYSEVDVQEIHIHPQYDAYNILYDYAILKTKKSIPFSKTVNAATTIVPLDVINNEHRHTFAFLLRAHDIDSHISIVALDVFQVHNW